VKASSDARKRSVKRSHDRKSRKPSELDIGQPVFFAACRRTELVGGHRTKILGPTTYQVGGLDGGTYRRNLVHMTTTKVTPTIRDKFPTIASRTPDVSPGTHQSQAPQTHSPPTDSSFKERQRRSAHDQDKAGPFVSLGQSLSANRLRRDIKPPIRFKDYVSKW